MDIIFYKLSIQLIWADGDVDDDDDVLMVRILR